MLLSEHQQDSFAKRGLICLEKLVPEATVAVVRDAALKALEEAGVWQHGEWVGDVSDERSFRSRLLGAVKRRTKDSRALKKIETEALLEAVRRLAGGQPVRPLTSRLQLLFAPPDTTSWSVPHDTWHIDVARLGRVGVSGVQMFAFLDAVTPRGGGTLVVAGSHRLFNDGRKVRAGKFRKLLSREPYFRELFDPKGTDRQHLAHSGRIGDVELQLVELCGDPGDVFLTDMRLMHSRAPNSTRVPRLMVSQRYIAESALERIGELSPVS